MPKRFGIDPDIGETLNDIQRGRLATVERMRAIEAKALRRLDRRKPPDDGDS